MNPNALADLQEERSVFQKLVDTDGMGAERQLLEIIGGDKFPWWDDIDDGCDKVWAVTRLPWWPGIDKRRTIAKGLLAMVVALWKDPGSQEREEDVARQALRTAVSVTDDVTDLECLAELLGDYETLDLRYNVAIALCEVASSFRATNTRIGFLFDVFGDRMYELADLTVHRDVIEAGSLVTLLAQASLRFLILTGHPQAEEMVQRAIGTRHRWFVRMTADELIREGGMHTPVSEGHPLYDDVVRLAQQLQGVQ